MIAAAEADGANHAPSLLVSRITGSLYRAATPRGQFRTIDPQPSWRPARSIAERRAPKRLPRQISGAGNLSRQLFQRQVFWCRCADLAYVAPRNANLWEETMRRSLVKLVLMVLIGAAGCHRHSFVVGKGGNLNLQPAYSHWHAHWLLGLIGEDTVNVKSVCPSGNATIKDHMSFLNGLVAVLIGIVYSPTEVEVYCDTSGRSTKLMLTPDQMEKLALRPEVQQWIRSENPELGAKLDRAFAERACFADAIALRR